MEEKSSKYPTLFGFSSFIAKHLVRHQLPNKLVDVLKNTMRSESIDLAY
ncbi:MAG: hypothetical protein GYB40_04565 [Vibrionaceae bacterium]|nr:hypothetical protein [Vibrionaceae bacterium]